MHLPALVLVHKMAWLTLEQARAELGGDAPLNDEALTRLLEAAQTQVETYAPALNPGTEPPANYKQALALQLRELNRARGREGDVLGFADGYTVRVRPLDATVKALLRPPRPSKVR